MWEATEPFDDLHMLYSKRKITVTQRFAKLAAQFLIFQVFRVHVREIEENAKLSIDCQIMPSPDCVSGIMKRKRVRRIHMGRTAKTVSRKLVQQEKQRQTVFRCS